MAGQAPRFRSRGEGVSRAQTLKVLYEIAFVLFIFAVAIILFIYSIFRDLFLFTSVSVNPSTQNGRKKSLGTRDARTQECPRGRFGRVRLLPMVVCNISENAAHSDSKVQTRGPKVDCTTVSSEQNGDEKSDWHYIIQWQSNILFLFRRTRQNKMDLVSLYGIRARHIFNSKNVLTI